MVWLGLRGAIPRREPSGAPFARRRRRGNKRLCLKERYPGRLPRRLGLPGVASVVSGFCCCPTAVWPLLAPALGYGAGATATLWLQQPSGLQHATVQLLALTLALRACLGAARPAGMPACPRGT